MNRDTTVMVVMGIPAFTDALKWFFHLSNGLFSIGYACYRCKKIMNFAVEDKFEDFMSRKIRASVQSRLAA